jgi:hypothetical protein
MRFQLDAPWRREAGFAVSWRATGSSEVRFAFFTPLPREKRVARRLRIVLGVHEKRAPDSEWKLIFPHQ